MRVVPDVLTLSKSACFVSNPPTVDRRETLDGETTFQAVGTVTILPTTPSLD